MPGCGALLPMSLAASTRSPNIHRLANPRPCQPISCVFPAQERGRAHADGTRADEVGCPRPRLHPREGDFTAGSFTWTRAVGHRRKISPYIA